MTNQKNNPDEDLFTPDLPEDVEYDDPRHYEDDRLDALTGTLSPGTEGNDLD